MNRKSTIERCLLLYIPWGLSLFFVSSPVISYLIAWTGSFYIFYLSLTGKIKQLPGDLSFAEQLMRPIIIVQIIFAGYMCCTSIFYFLSVLDYQYFQKLNSIALPDPEKLALTAQCQRYYCLGHASLVTGISVFMKYPFKKRYYIEKENLVGLLLKTALIVLLVSACFLHIPGLQQFYYQLSSLSFIAGTIALAFAIPQKKVPATIICLCLYLFNFYEATISGFKEPIIISVLVLGIFLYPNYKKLVLITFVPGIFLLFVILPAYVSSFRESAWSGESSREIASKKALDAALNKGDETESNWIFLVYRLSEIDMFTTYVQSTPARIDYYGLQLLQQSAIAIVPRVCWPAKPVTEDMIMERVYNAGVVERDSSVSAKPTFIVDAYLSGGVFGIFISLFLYGAIAQVISQKAEYLFGGYLLGTALIFSGLFQIFWRGLSFEFIINTVFWSYITMLLIFRVFRLTNVLKEV